MQTNMAKNILFIEKTNIPADLHSVILNALKISLHTDYKLITQESVLISYILEFEFESFVAITHSDLLQIICRGVNSTVNLQKQNNAAFLHFDTATQQIMYTNRTQSKTSAWQTETYSFKEYLSSAPFRLSNLLNLDNNYIQFKAVRQGMVSVNIGDILYLQGQGYNTLIRTVFGDTYTVRESQKKILEKLPNHFVKTHQSYSINSKKVSQIEDNRLMMKNGQVIPVSKLLLPNVSEMVSIFS
jgi:hypothetical protein